MIRNRVGPEYRPTAGMNGAGPLFQVVAARLVNVVVKRNQRKYQRLMIDAAASQFPGGKHADRAALTFYILYSG